MSDGIGNKFTRNIDKIYDSHLNSSYIEGLMKKASKNYSWINLKVKRNKLDIPTRKKLEGVEAFAKQTAEKLLGIKSKLTEKEQIEFDSTLNELRSQTRILAEEGMSKEDKRLVSDVYNNALDSFLGNPMNGWVGYRLVD